ncbi:hypothetical protein FI667_g8923, partial [Globisporangium splendens]
MHQFTRGSFQMTGMHHPPYSRFPHGYKRTTGATSLPSTGAMDPHGAAANISTNANTRDHVTETASPGRMDAAFNDLSLDSRTVLSRLFPSNPHNSPISSPDDNGGSPAKLCVETCSLHAALAFGLSARDRSATTWPDRVMDNTNNAVSHHQSNLSVAPMRPSGFFQRQSEPKSVSSARARSATIQQAVNHHHSDPKNEDDVVILREQVALLRKSLDEEKKRRIREQKLMQEKIIELQGLIRSDFPEHKKAQERRLVQMRSPSAARSKLRSAGSGSKLMLVKPQLVRKSSKSNSSSSGSSAGSCLDLVSSSLSVANDEATGNNQQSHNNRQQQLPSEDEATSSSGKLDKEAMDLRMKKQLTKLRARMQTMVTDAQTEAKYDTTLRTLLTNEQLRFERKERHWRVETNAKFAALEKKHAVAKKKLTAKTAILSSHTAHLMEKDARIAHLELALGGKRIVMETHGGGNATTKWS